MDFEWSSRLACLKRLCLTPGNCIRLVLAYRTLGEESNWMYGSNFFFDILTLIICVSKDDSCELLKEHLLIAGDLVFFFFFITPAWVWNGVLRLWVCKWQVLRLSFYVTGCGEPTSVAVQQLANSLTAKHDRLPPQTRPKPAVAESKLHPVSIYVSLIQGENPETLIIPPACQITETHKWVVKAAQRPLFLLDAFFFAPTRWRFLQKHFVAFARNTGCISRFPRGRFSQYLWINISPFGALQIWEQEFKDLIV